MFTTVPTQAVPDVRWPLILGIVAASVAAFALARILVGAVVTALAPQDAMLAFVIPSMLVNAALNLLLLFSAILLIRRRRLAITLLLLWGCLRIATFSVSFAIQFWLVRSVSGLSLGPADHVGGVPGFVLMTSAAVLVAVGPPIFLFFWFSRATIRRQISAW